MTREAVLVVALVGLALAGCLGGRPAPPTSTNDSRTEPGAEASDAPSEVNRSHVHDRWNGKSRHVLMNRTVVVDKAQRYRPGDSLVNWALCETTNCDYKVRFTLPAGNIVPPGTDRLVVEADWRPQGAWDRNLSLSYRAANQAKYADRGRQAAPAEWTIDTTTQMADGGHAQRSLWDFQLMACHCIVAARNASVDVDVTVRAYRVNGSLPLEPRHPDWWSDRRVHTLWSGNASSRAVESGLTPLPLEGSLGAFLNGTEHEIVPFGTRWLVAVVDVSDEDRVPGSPRAVAEWDLDPKPPREGWRPDGASDGRHVFTLPVREGMTDGIYDKNRSRWRFAWWLRGSDTGVDDPLLGGDLTQPTYWDVDWRAHVYAVNATNPREAVRSVNTS